MARVGLGMRILRAKFASPAALRSAMETQCERGGIFVATRTVLPLGEQVVVDVRIAGLRTKSLIRGSVVWRRAGRQRGECGGLRAGLGIEFLESERQTASFLKGLAHEQVVDVSQRRHVRLPVELVASWRTRHEREQYQAHVDDIGAGGAFLRTCEFLPVGTPVTLEFAIPGTDAPIALDARIARTHHSDGEEGMGVEFRCRDSGGARRLKEVVRRIAEASFDGASRRVG